MEKISVTVITCNEEKNIERCLESLRWADEIVIIDTFSSDRTVELCRRFTDKVYQEKWSGYGKQKNLCAEKATHRWVLNVDADEVVSSECAEEIQKGLENGLLRPVYSFPRKNFFGNRWVRFAGWYPDRIARLYDKSRVKFSEPPVHEKLGPTADMGSFQNPLLHYSYQGMEDYVTRQNHYSTLSSQGMIERGEAATCADLVLRPAAAFLKIFFLQQGFREGLLGFFLSVSGAFYTFLKYAKTRSV